MKLNSMTDEQRRATLIDGLKRWSKVHGRAPTYKECAEDPELHSPSTYRNVFGSWNDALKAAGLDAMKQGRPAMALWQKRGLEDGGHECVSCGSKDVGPDNVYRMDPKLFPGGDAIVVCEVCRLNRSKAVSKFMSSMYLRFNR